MRAILNYRGYSVSKRGRVFKNGKKIKTRIHINSRSGYKSSRAKVDGDEKLVSRLVALAYIPNPNNYPCVLHLDNNPLNNHYTNLYWGTHKMNMDQMARDGRRSNGKQTKLSAKDVEEIRLSNLPNKELSELYNVHESNISNIRNYKRWK